MIDNIYTMRKFVISLALFFSYFLCFTQSNFFDNYVYQSWSVFGGLSGTTANDIFQTKDGYIDVGTYEGLVKFDGVEFTTINRSTNKEYGFVSVRTILQDSRGIIWLGSNDEGLQKISPDDNRLYTMENGLPNNSVRTLCEDKYGNIWIGTASGVVYLTPDGKLITPQFGAGTTANGVIASNIFCDFDGRIWLTTSNENGLFLCKDNLFNSIDEFEKFSTFFATAIMQDKEEKFWIGLGDKSCFAAGYSSFIAASVILRRADETSIIVTITKIAIRIAAETYFLLMRIRLVIAMCVVPSCIILCLLISQ